MRSKLTIVAMTLAAGFVLACGAGAEDEPAQDQAGSPPPPPAAATTTAPVPAAPVRMPNLVGQNAAVADDQLKRLGFTNVQFGSRDPNDTVVLLLSNWTVTKQSTKAGTKVDPATLVVLTCTKQ